MLIALLLSLSVTAAGSTFEVNGINYLLGADSTAAVIQKDPKYSGTIIVPSTVSYNGSSYKVTKIQGYAFVGCENLTSIKIGGNVKVIGGYAFKGCTLLKEVIIPDNVTSIGASCFKDCTNLESVVIGDSIKYLPEFLFEYVDNLSVTIGKGVKQVDSNAFNFCDSLCVNLTDLTVWLNVEMSDYRPTAIANFKLNGELLEDLVIPDNVEEVKDGVFYGATCLKSITIPKSLNKVGAYSFSGCSNLKEVNLEDLSAWCNSDYQGDRILKNSGTIMKLKGELLENLEIPKDVKKVKDYAFRYVSSIKKVVIHDDVDSIGKGAFSECDNLNTVIVGDRITSIGYEAFKDCDNLKEVDIANLSSWCRLDFGTSVTHPFSINEGVLKLDGEVLEHLVIPKDITEIKPCTFYNCASLKTVKIHENVDSIGTGAFNGCSSLERVEIEDGIVKIKHSAFANCGKLKSINIPNSVRIFENWLFEDCASLETVTLPNTLTFIPYAMFYGCSSLDSISIPESVSAIGDWAFYGCSGLKSVSLPSGLASIGKYAFFNSGLTSVAIPSNISVIEYCTFSCCRELESVVIPSSVTSINNGAFNGCWKLKSVMLPSSVTFIDGNAFSRCSDVSSMIVEIGNKMYDSRNGCNAIIETSTNTLIAGCKTTVIPENVEKISEDAFIGCDRLVTMTIPESVSEVGNYAFEHCSSLKTMYSKSVTPPTAYRYTFEYIPTDAILYVPVRAKDAYMAALGWNSFANIVETDFSEIVSGLDDTITETVEVVVAGNEIIVSGIENNVKVEVYNMNGTLVYGGTNKSISVNGKGAYIVVVNGKYYKVLIG